MSEHTLEATVRFIRHDRGCLCCEGRKVAARYYDTDHTIPAPQGGLTGFFSDAIKGMPEGTKVRISVEPVYTPPGPLCVPLISLHPSHSE